MDVVGIAGTLGRAQFEAQYLGAVLKKQAEVTEQLGVQAIQLIQAASIDPQVGGKIDLQA